MQVREFPRGSDISAAMRPTVSCCALLIWLQLLAFCQAAAPGTRADTPETAAGAPGIRVPEGFRVEHFADDDLAHDIHSLTIDSAGRVVVSGPGYIRILIDGDSDGRADSFRQFVDLPKTGAQGMYWSGRSLLCSGDDGLQVFRDDNRDDVADGPAEVFLRIAAGGEHHVHSIQRGPDGWWYVIAGNTAGVTGAYATLATSPLRNPVNGVLMRLKPDLSGGEIVADGLRNAYDFAFSVTGDLFTYDSDDERDISLPWYLPTRVFQILPMSHAGWVSAGWKRPERFADMPPVIAAFGRGSPTGVVCYQHSQFTDEYRGALFVLDWTLGRIDVLPLESDGGGWKSQPVSFAAGQDQFGFAPTDLEVAPDGSLYVSVGGRGTRGSVFRIVRAAGENRPAPQVPRNTARDRLDRVLTIEQPLSSWSRATWVPLATKLGGDMFRAAALDNSRSAAERMRAIEILVEQFGGVDAAMAPDLIRATSSRVRARAAWAAGRSRPEAPDSQIVGPLLQDADPLVQRCALEALVTADGAVLEDFLPQIATCLSSDSREVRLMAAQLTSKLTQSQRSRMSSLPGGDLRGRVWLHLGAQLRSSSVSIPAAQLAVTVITDAQQPVELRREAVRLLQLALGDVGPTPGRAAVLDSYTSRGALADFDLELNPLRASLADSYPSGDDELDYELIRVFAMTTPLNRELFSRILAGITSSSSPADDIHRLAALAQFELERSEEESRAIAQALVAIDVKIRQRGMRQDTSWDDRIGELFAALCRVDPALPHLIPGQPLLGQPGHTLFTAKVTQESLPEVIGRFVATISADPEYQWTNDVVFLLGESSQPEHRQLLRDQLENLSVRDAVLIVLAEAPIREDRAHFLNGLDSPQLNAVEACVQALTKLPRSNSPEEQFRLIRTARRLVTDEREFRLRETVMRLLQNNTGLTTPFVFSAEGHRPQPESMQEWHAALQKKYPDYQEAHDEDSARVVLALLPDVDWMAGDAQRGRRLFERISCARCHGGRLALGPDLTGVTRRFSRDDLFAAVVDPDRDISPRYQTTTVLTRSGRSYTGLIVYESADGMLLRDAAHRTYRLEGDDIETQHRQRVSLMPAGLLKGLNAAALADLYSYLQSL